VIVARKIEKNGKNNSDKKNRERTSTTSSSRRNFSREQREKWKATKPNGTTLQALIPATQPKAMKGGIIEEGKVIVPGIPTVVVVALLPPPRLHISQEIIFITSRIWKNKSINRHKN